MGNMKAEPCDFVCERIFASAISEEIRKPTLRLFYYYLKKILFLNPLMKAPHIRPSDAQ
jgi:hypothetical protein